MRAVMLPGKLRKAFKEVRKAKQEGQPALATLCFLRALEASNAGQAFVLTGNSAFVISWSLV